MKGKTMFQVLVSTPTRKSMKAYDRDRNRAVLERVRPMAGVSGTVTNDRVAVFARMEGQLIRCLSGSLWVTIQDDREDHVLVPNEWLLVKTPGKVIISGKGTYEV